MSETLPPGGSRDRSSTWIWGLVLIAVGVLFLLQNLQLLPTIGNWWAFFILIPAIASFAGAWALYQRSGRLTRAAVGPLMAGIAILGVAVIFFLDLDWGRVWPVFLIIFGLGALLSSIVRD
jgi:hypothetical protein